MALIFEDSRCALCDKPVKNGKPLFATSGVFFPEEHPLFPFCDAPMHWDCYADWPDREQFARAYVRMWEEAEPGNPYWGRAFHSPQVLVTVNPDPPVRSVRVLLADTGSDLRVPLDQWESWLTDEWAAFGVHPVEQNALAAVIPQLRENVPTTLALLGAVDWEAKQVTLELKRERYAERERVRLRSPSAHNKACRSLLRVGVKCPSCGAVEPRYIDRSPEAKSEWVCRECETTFGPAEVFARQL